MLSGKWECIVPKLEQMLTLFGHVWYNLSPVYRFKIILLLVQADNSLLKELNYISKAFHFVMLTVACTLALISYIWCSPRTLPFLTSISHFQFLINIYIQFFHYSIFFKTCSFSNFSYSFISFSTFSLSNLLFSDLFPQ